jgi:hypothetical protein
VRGAAATPFYVTRGSGAHRAGLAAITCTEELGVGPRPPTTEKFGREKREEPLASPSGERKRGRGGALAV